MDGYSINLNFNQNLFIVAAQQAFEVINRAYKVLSNDITRKKCLDVYEEAKGRTDHMVTNEFCPNIKK